MSDPLGAYPGSMSDPTSNVLSNEYPVIHDTPVSADAPAVNPNQVRTGINRGSQVVIGSDGKPQVLSGSQPTFGNGFFVAKPSYDVTTETDSSHLVFNSNQNIFKILSSGIANMSVAGTLASGATQTTLVAHNQTSVPAIMAFLYGDPTSSFIPAGTYHSLPYSIPVSVTGPYQAGFMAGFLIDATNITFQVSNYTSVGLSGIGPVSFKYYILQETAS